MLPGPVGPPPVEAQAFLSESLCLPFLQHQQAGLDEAAAQLRGYSDCIDSDPATTENRIVVLTDAEANAGDVSEEGLGARLKALAADRIHVSIVGVGLDFNTSLVEAISRVRGANYFSVHSPGGCR